MSKTARMILYVRLKKYLNQLQKINYRKSSKTSSRN